jgi:microcystin degradation protein MlrC
MQALKNALAGAGSGPVMIADCADNPGGGGLENSTALLRALIDAGVQNCAYGMICDPDSLTHAVPLGSASMSPCDWVAAVSSLGPSRPRSRFDRCRTGASSSPAL